MHRNITVLLSCFILSGCGQYDTYSLYRGSVVDGVNRIYIANFDAQDGGTDSYNLENCQIAADLFTNQPGVIVKYWCEKSN